LAAATIVTVTGVTGHEVGMGSGMTETVTATEAGAAIGGGDVDTDSVD
jgi:hypothetical protein